MNENKQKRILKKNKRIKKREAMAVDITSLLDILVILLVFLLQSYNASNLQLDLVDNISPPGSQARDLGEDSVIIQVNSDKEIWFEYEKLNEKVRDGEITRSLLEKLKTYQTHENKDHTKEESPKRVNLVFDKNLPYSTMQTVMQTAAKAGHSNFNFIVMADHSIQ